MERITLQIPRTLRLCVCMRCGEERLWFLPHSDDQSVANSELWNLLQMTCRPEDMLPLTSPLRRKTANRSIDRPQDTQRQYDRPWSTFRDVVVSRQCGAPRFRADTRVFTRMTHVSMHGGLRRGCVLLSRLSFYCVIFACNIPKSASLQFTAQSLTGGFSSSHSIYFQKGFSRVWWNRNNGHSRYLVECPRS